MKTTKFVRRILSAAAFFFAGAWTGGAVMQYRTWRQHPEINMPESAPWYTGVMLQGAVTAALILVCLIGRRLLPDHYGKDETNT